MTRHADPEYYAPRQKGGIPHHPDCDWSEIAAHLPLATATGRGPITGTEMLDGSEMLRCSRCGARALWRGKRLIRADPDEDARQRRWHAERQPGEPPKGGRPKETAHELEQKLWPILLELWDGTNQPTQASVAARLRYSDTRAFEKRLAKAPGLWERLLRRLPEVSDGS